jgi:rhodanese-related sulfurtransferase
MIARLLSMILFTIFLHGCAEPPPYNNLDNTQLQTMLEQGVPLYDIRRPEEWQQTGIIAGSRRLTFVDDMGRVYPDFMSRFTQTIHKDDPVILICRSGNRTDVLARYLVEKMGYSQVYNVRNGIGAWLREDRPVNRL